MATISDPSRLSKEELLAEWAVREEELRLQFESLKTAQTQNQVLLQRYERIFAFCPLPLMIVDSRGTIQESNNAARHQLRGSFSARNNMLLNALEDGSRLGLTQAFRSFMNDGAAKAQELTLVFRDVDVSFDALLVTLDHQAPPSAFVLMLTPIAS